MTPLKNRQGFSVIEMMLSTVLVVAVGAVSYRVLSKQTANQIASIQSVKESSSIQSAMNRFKLDVLMMDPNWSRYGVPPMFVHQGYSHGKNYYSSSTLSNVQAGISLMDGVTLLRRNPKSDRIYLPNTAVAENLCYNQTLGPGDQNIFASNIALDTTEGLAVGDWMLAYQAGSYVLGVITQIGSATSPTDDSSRKSNKNLNEGSTIPTIRLRSPNAAETATISSSGYVTKPGVVWASFDTSGSITSSTADNSICFQTSRVNFQKLGNPVSYYVDYLTTDGEAKKSTNAYKLDSKGNKVNMLVRSEYKAGVEKREYISVVHDLGFTYDLMDTESSDSLRNIGRSLSTEGLIGVLEPSSGSFVNFFPAYKIVAVKMSASVMTINPNNKTQEWKQNRELKVALDPSLKQGIYQDENTVVSSLTDSLDTLSNNHSGNGGSENIGKPLYLVNANGENEMLVPVSTLVLDGNGNMAGSSDGAIYVYNANGCAVNDSSCAPTSDSVIKFIAGNNTKFFPNTIAQVSLGNGQRRIIVGGIAITNAEGSVVRKPGFGYIDLSDSQTLTNALDNAQGGTDTCSIKNCHWKTVETNTADLMNLTDSANISVNPNEPNEIYVAPMTKKVGKSSMSSVFRGVWSGSAYSFSKFADIQGTESSKVVTAISDKPVRILGTDYLAVCVSKSMDDTCNGECMTKSTSQTSVEVNQTVLQAQGVGDHSEGDEEVSEGTGKGGGSPVDVYGEIKLIKQGSGILEGQQGITIVKHNYRCSSLSVDSGNNLIVSGRLTIQPIPYQEIKAAALKGTSDRANDILFLDEIASGSGSNAVYADYYQVDPQTYAAEATPQYIGWLTGVSAVEFSNGTFGILNGNKMKLAANYMENGTGATQEFSNAGISEVRLAGISDRVVASIETDPTNINKSVITATYVAQTSELPSVYIPGKFFVDPANPRLNPTPLPSMPATISESSWFSLYMSMLTPQGDDGLNSSMPTLGASVVAASSCLNSIPSTCQ